MRIYYRGEQRSATHTMFVSPASDPEGIKGGVPAEWLGVDGQPILFTVSFVDGKAEVPASLGKFMIDRGLAKRTALILPSLVAA